VYLLEHDAKELMAGAGIPVPPGCLVTDADSVPDNLPPGPWVVKAQVSAGGRGKAGLVRKADERSQIAAMARELCGTTFKGRTVRAMRVEQQVCDGTEAYLSMMVDGGTGRVRVIMAAEGGVDIESLGRDKIRTVVVAAESRALGAAVRELAASWPDVRGEALQAAGERVAALLLDREAMLVEINPLFVREDGTWIAGDAKIVTDDNALERQAEAKALLERRAAAYPEASVKLEHGFDYVVVDAAGEVGLLTTGAGLSMMLIDELRQQGLRPYNFLDIRTGGMRGDPSRLVSVLRWLTEGPQIKVLLINIFAGITDLGEFSRLLVTALERVPELRVPVVARLVGNGLPAAMPVLSAAGIRLHTDLDAAVQEVRTVLKTTEAA
jgi:succinyl-CoA synthetase beta subunit